MPEIKLIPPEDQDLFLRIAVDAYPTFRIVTEDDRKKFRDNFLKRHQDPRIALWGLYRDNKLLGGLRLFDYKMNVHGSWLLTGGGGMLAVDIQHKKEHVARDLMTFFIEHYREREAPMAILWPFRPDFYKAMGFGYGSKIQQYRVKPQDFPDSPLRSRVRLLTPDDQAAAVACYNRYGAATTGMVEETEIGWNIMVEMNPQVKIVGFEDGGQITGLMFFTFEPGQPASFLNNDIKISKFIYTTRDSLYGLLGFLHSQKDQIDKVYLSVHDEHFEHLLADVRDGSGELITPIYHRSNLSGVGLQYRVLNVPLFFKETSSHAYGTGSGTVKFTVRDNFLKENDGSTVVRFTDGHPEVLPSSQADVEVRIDIAEFSSMVMGAVPFKTLYRYGLAEISDPKHVDFVDNLFRTDSGPVCMMMF